MKRLEKLYNLHEVADILHLSVDAVRTQIEQRRIAYTRIGPRGPYRIAESAIIDFLEGQHVSAFGEKS